MAGSVIGGCGSEYSSEVLPFVAAPTVKRVEVVSQSEGFSVALHPTADVDPYALVIGGAAE